MLKIFSLTFFLLLSILTFSQSIQQISLLDGPGYSLGLGDHVKQSNGNSVVTTLNEDNVNFIRNGINLVIHNETNPHFLGSTVLLLAPNHQFLKSHFWSVQDPNSGRFFIKKVLVDGSDHIYLIGDFNGLADFDPSPTISDTKGPTTSGVFEGFVIKLSPTGDYLWSRTIDNTSATQGDRCDVLSGCIDASGDICLGGSFSGDYDFDPGSSTSLISSTGNQHGFFLRLDSAGNFISVKTTKGMGLNSIAFLDQTNDGGHLVYGEFREEIDLDLNGNSQTILYGDTVIYRHHYVAKYNQNDSLVWYNRHDSLIGPRQVHKDGQDNLYMLSLVFEDAVVANDTIIPVGTGNTDVLLEKIDGSGAHLWYARINTIKNDGYLNLEVTDDRVLAMYQFRDTTFTQSRGNDTTLINTNASPAPFSNQAVGVSMFDNLGNHLRSFTYQSTDQVFGGSNMILDNNQLDLSIRVDGQTDLDPGPGIANFGPANHVFAYALISMTIDTSGLVALDPPSSFAAFTVYPNPTNGNFSLKTEPSIQAKQVQVFDLTGRLLQQQSFMESTIELGLKDQPQGIYLIQLTIGTDTFLRRIIKS